MAVPRAPALSVITCRYAFGSLPRTRPVMTVSALLTSTSITRPLACTWRPRARLPLSIDRLISASLNATI